jgi:hypothetical protein
VLATDTRVGVICYMLYKGTMGADLFFLFVYLLLIPSLRAISATPRVVMCDNLRAHLQRSVAEALKSEGHTILYRPVHSPDFSWCEMCFEHIARHLQCNEGFLTPETFGEWVTRAIDTLSPSYVRAYAAGSHYFVPELKYRPYLGIV